MSEMHTTKQFSNYKYYWMPSHFILQADKQIWLFLIKVYMSLEIQTDLPSWSVQKEDGPLALNGDIPAQLDKSLVFVMPGV